MRNWVADLTEIAAICFLLELWREYKNAALRGRDKACGGESCEREPRG